MGDGPLGYQNVLGAEGLRDNMAEGASEGGDDPRKFPEQEEEEESQLFAQNWSLQMVQCENGIRVHLHEQPRGKPLGVSS